MEILILFSALVSVTSMALGGDWSTCSRTCGVGIMQRTIPCQINDGCNETKQEFRACNVKSCPGDNTDFRGEQCKNFGEELTPFINKSDPCKLLCSSPEQSAIQKGLAVDGTSCSSHGVCVSGECVPFGCDHVLGSKKTINKCGTCSDLCVQFPCTFMNSLHNGYHTTLPYESTSVKIVLGESSCNFKAINDSTHSQHFNSDQSNIFVSETVFMISDSELIAEGPLQSPVTIEVDCPKPSHKIQCHYHASVHIPYSVLEISHIYEWAVGETFTPCSQTCGRGVHMQEIYCRTIAIHDHIRVPDSECMHSGQSKTGLFPSARFCDQPACPSKWMHSDWTHCSKSCGGGERIRDISCVQVYRDGVEPITTPGRCDNKIKPASRHECNKHPCHTHWHAGEWSKCSADCGEGIQYRNVTCRDLNGNEIHRHNCSLRAKPAIENSCIGAMCIHKWVTSNWTNCSVSCGEGVQTRLVNCTENGTVVDDRVCLENIPNTKPLEEITCQGPCCNGMWTVQNWLKKCVAPRCHEAGVQYRNVYCVHNGKMSGEYDHIKCNPVAKPTHMRGCYKIEGCIPEWFKTEWGPCSKTCGGMQTRMLHCKLGNVTLDDHSRCPDNAKPSVLQECGPECPKPDHEICLPNFCDDDDLSPCQKKCCEECKIIPSYLGLLVRYNICERPCCQGLLSWKGEGCT